MNSGNASQANSRQIATSFVGARQRAESLAAYPGDPPSSLGEAYGIQDAAIELWQAPIAGWKVGRILGAAAIAFGIDRLAGPVFESMLRKSDGSQISAPVFKGGFAAVEGEIVVILGDDAPADKLDWSTDDAVSMIHSMRAGVEIASSPYAAINMDGPLVTISDFGNNFGAIVGDEIPDWRALRTEQWVCRTLIDGNLVGENSPAGIPGGPVESLRFLLENTARRGRSLKKGMVICTGAVTGVHEIAIGQSANVEFVGARAIKCRFVDAADRPAWTKTNHATAE